MECCREIRGVINTEEVIRGGVSMQGSLSGTIGSDVNLGGEVNYNNGASPPVYDGAYTVTPLPFETQTLNTNNRLMVNDVTVLEIPYFETSNISGKTVYIGGE